MSLHLFKSAALFATLLSGKVGGQVFGDECFDLGEVRGSFPANFND